MRKYLAFYETEWPANIAELTAVENKPFVGYLKDKEVKYTEGYKPIVGPANNEIWYTSNDGNVVTPYDTAVFGANIISNTYEDSKGIIKFDNNVTSIGDKAFWDCELLTSVTIPNSVTSIGDEVFKYCYRITYPVYNAHCFAYLPTSFEGAYTIPDGIKLIVGSAFYNCSSLTSVTIPNSVTSIGTATFRDCTAITSVTIGNSVKSIGDKSFYGCSSLTSITIPNSVTSIGDDAFDWCLSLTSITIPDSVTSIGESVFGNCESLTSITCEAIAPPTLGLNNDIIYVTVVYVPAESVEAYKAAESWSYYADKIQPIL